MLAFVNGDTTIARGESPPIVESVSRWKVARVGRSLFERDSVADFEANYYSQQPTALEAVTQ